MQYSTQNVGLIAKSSEQRTVCDQIALQFGIRRILAPDSNAYYLCRNAQQLALHHADSKNKPIVIDFVGGVLAHRRQFGGGRNQPLLRAMGVKSGFLPTVLDATAGLGRDSFVLASLGLHVLMSERSPILSALLQDAMRRAAHDDELGLWINKRLTLHYGDSTTLLASLSDADTPDTIYLDPMYPQDKSRARVKKEMYALQQILGPDIDSSTLFKLALNTAKRRVVVKRPGHAPCLHEQPPSTSISSKKTRYDIYMTHNIGRTTC